MHAHTHVFLHSLHGGACIYAWHIHGNMSTLTHGMRCARKVVLSCARCIACNATYRMFLGLALHGVALCWGCAVLCAHLGPHISGGSTRRDGLLPKVALVHRRQQDLRLQLTGGEGAASRGQVPACTHRIPHDKWVTRYTCDTHALDKYDSVVHPLSQLPHHMRANHAHLNYMSWM